MVDVLKLAVSHRSGDKGRDVLSAVLSGMGTAYPQVSQSEHAHTHTPYLGDGWITTANRHTRLLKLWNHLVTAANQNTPLSWITTRHSLITANHNTPPSWITTRHSLIPANQKSPLTCVTTC